MENTETLQAKLARKACQELKDSIDKAFDKIIVTYGDLYIKTERSTDLITVWKLLREIKDGIFEELKNKHADRYIDNFLREVEELKDRVESLESECE
jgi:hypothetical protein